MSICEVRICPKNAITPMTTNEANQQAKKDKEAKSAEPVPTEQAEAEKTEKKSQ